VSAQDLVSAAGTLLDGGLHAPALSLSVLAIEELGKLMALDGLLYARRDDDRAKRFEQAMHKHDTKLDFLNLFPLFVDHLMRADPRYKDERAFKQAHVINIRQLQADRNAVVQHLPKKDLGGLNGWKKDGFYAAPSGHGFVPPRDAVNTAFAQAVCRFAWRATTSIDFCLKGGNLERYIANARAVRRVFTEEALQELEQRAEHEAQRLFGRQRTNGDDGSAP
jgi:AbiV family abortive infection protein